jgi:hypothetical protein
MAMADNFTARRLLSYTPICGWGSSLGCRSATHSVSRRLVLLGNLETGVVLLGNLETGVGQH